MYEKNLTKKIVLRLSENDFDFLVHYASYYDISVSEALRGVIGFYRRNIDFKELEVDVHGYTVTPIDN